MGDLSEKEIRTRAYHLWKEAGEPSGRADAFWYQAEKELLAERAEAGAIRECEEHGWAKDRADPHARERAIMIARQDPPWGVTPDAAVVAVEDVLASMGDGCPECPPDAN